MRKPVLCLVLVFCLLEQGLEIGLALVGFSFFVIFSSLFLLLTSLSLYLGRNIFSINKITLCQPEVVFWLSLGGYHFYSLMSLVWGGITPQKTFSSVQSFWYFVIMCSAYYYLKWANKPVVLRLYSNAGLIVCLAFLGLSIVAVDRGVGWGVFADRERFSLALFKDYNIYTVCFIFAFAAIFLRFDGRLPHLGTTALYIVGVLLICAVGVMSGSRRALVLYLPILLSVLSLTAIARSPKSFLRAASLAIVFVLCGVFLKQIDFGKLGVNDRVVEETTSRANRGVGFISGEHAHVGDRFEKWGRSGALLESYAFWELFVGRGEKSYLESSLFVRDSGGRDSPHNFILVDLLEGGIFKLIVLLVPLVMIVLMLYRLRKESFWVVNFAFSSAFIWVITVSISGEGYFQTRIAYFPILLTALVSSFVYSNSKNKGYRLVE